MDEKDYFKAIEQLSSEKEALKESNVYHIGSAIEVYLDAIKSADFKRLSKLLSDKRASNIIKKKYPPKVSTKCVKSNLLPVKEKVVVYSCILGDYDLITEPLIKPDNVTYVLLTDDKSKYDGITSKFNIIELDKLILKHGNILANRYVKFHPKVLFGDYDYSIYIDGNVRMISDASYIAAYTHCKTGIAMHRHRSRDCIYEEGEVCKLLNRGNKSKIDEELNYYKSQGFPQHFGMNEATIIASDLNNPLSEKLLDEWWQEFIKRGSYRDQLAWPFVLWMNNLSVDDVGCLGNDIYKNPMVEMRRHK